MPHFPLQFGSDNHSQRQYPLHSMTLRSTVWDQLLFLAVTYTANYSGKCNTAKSCTDCSQNIYSVIIWKDKWTFWVTQFPFPILLYLFIFLWLRENYSFLFYSLQFPSSCFGSIKVKSSLESIIHFLFAIQNKKEKNDLCRFDSISQW